MQALASGAILKNGAPACPGDCTPDWDSLETGLAVACSRLLLISEHDETRVSYGTGLGRGVRMVTASQPQYVLAGRRSYAGTVEVGAVMDIPT